MGNKTYKSVFSYVTLLIAIGGIICLATSFDPEKTITSPFNNRELKLSNSSSDYSFFVAGHVYGNPGSPSVYPSSSFLANIDMINQNEVMFFILIGDNFQRCTPNDIENFRNVCLKIDVPMFNSVGNHDVQNRDLYNEYFGQTYYEFRQGSELYIILDSEIDHGEITGEQLQHLKNVINETIESKDIKNVFIFSHKLIWSVEDEDLNIVYQHINSLSGYANNDNYKSIVQPEIIRLSQAKNVYIISGDIGVKWTLPLFYHKDKQYNISYIACGLGDTERDAVIRVEVSKEGEVTFKPISLTGEKLENISYYGTDYWDAYFSDQNKTG